MRKKVLMALTPLLLLGSAGCFVPPEPPRASPAPTLPRESIAYDDLPVVTDRPSDFAGNCDRINGTPGLAQRMGFAAPPRTSSFEPGCTGETGAGETVILRPLSPSKLQPEPWLGAWNRPNTFPEHFRRIVLNERYYATTNATWRAGGSGCTVRVNVGGPNVIELTYLLAEERNSEFPSYEIPSAVRLSDAACPKAKEVTVTLLNALDPNGGSRGS